MSELIRQSTGSAAQLARYLKPHVEISHNSTFWLELGALAVVFRFVDERRSPFGRKRFHVIEASPIMERFPMSSKLNDYPPLLEYLFDLSRQTCDAWIAQHGEALGQRSTMDVQRLLPASVLDNICLFAVPAMCFG